MIEEERLRREKRQQEEWDKREKARIDLLYQVFDDRARKVQEHQAERDEEKRQREAAKMEEQRDLQSPRGRVFKPWKRMMKL